MHIRFIIFQSVSTWVGSPDKLNSNTFTGCIISKKQNDTIKKIVKTEQFGIKMIKLKEMTIVNCNEQQNKYLPAGFFTAAATIPSLLIGMNSGIVAKNNLNKKCSIDDSQPVPNEPLQLEALNMSIDSPDWKDTMNIQQRNFGKLKYITSSMTNKSVSRTRVNGFIKNIQSLLFYNDSTINKFSTQLKSFRFINGYNLFYSDLFSQHVFGQQTNHIR